MISGSDLNVRIKEAVKRQYPGTGDRVVACWDNFVAGKKLNRYVDKDGKKELTAKQSNELPHIPPALDRKIIDLGKDAMKAKKFIEIL